MKYDFTITRQTIVESPNAFSTFIFGVCSAVASQLYTMYSCFLENGWILGFSWRLFGAVPITETVIDVPKNSFFSTENLLWSLILCNVLFTVFMARYGIAAYKKKESSFFFTIGLFLSLYGVVNLYFGMNYTVDVTDRYFLLW